MIETGIVLVAVCAAAVWTGLRFKRALTGEEEGCSSGCGGCSSDCAPGPESKPEKIKEAGSS